MPTSCRGGIKPRRGVTLIEMLLVVTILSLLVGISYPAIASGIESLRIGGTADEIAALLNGALNRAERRQHGVEVIVVTGQPQRVVADSFEPGFQRTVEIPQNVRILDVQPPGPEAGGGRRFLVFPGGSPPRIAILLGNARGDRRLVRVDPVSGAPLIEKPQ